MSSASMYSGQQSTNLVKYNAVGVSLNSTGDQFVFTGLPTSPYRITSLVAWNFSASPGALVAFSLRDASTGAGNQLVTSGIGLNAIIVTPLTDAIPLSIASLFQNRVFNNTTLYFNVAVANVAAITCNLTLTVSIL